MIIYPTEDEECKTFCDWLLHYPHINEVTIHIVNEGKRTWNTGKKLKALGLKKGVSDYFMGIPSGGYHGLWIEMKRQKNGYLNLSQKEWMHRMNRNGYFAKVAYGADEAIKICKDYLGSYLRGKKEMEIPKNFKEKIKNLLMIQEGVKTHAYFDTEGHLTIGCGRFIGEGGFGLRKSEIDFMLDEDVKYYYETLAKNFDWFLKLDEVRKLVVLSMTFQLGMTKFRQFRKTIEAIKNNNFDEAAREMLNSRWAKQTSNRANHMATVMRTGEIY